MMLISAAITFAVALAGGQTPQPSLLRQVVPNPTGTNGYEDYLRAADLLAGPEMGYYLSWTPTKYADLKAATVEPSDSNDAESVRALQAELAFFRRLDGKTLLEVRTEAVKKYGRALDFLHAGNQKRVWDPRTGNLHFWTSFPEYAGLKMVAKFADMAAYVAFAEGRSRDGARVLIDSLQLGQNLEGNTMISHLVGTAIESISLAGFERFLPNLSRADAATIEAFVAKSLSGQPKIVDSIKTERLMTLTALQDVLYSKETVEDSSFNTDEQNKLLVQIRAMSPQAKQALQERATKRLNTLMGSVLQRFYGPESGWGVKSDQAEPGDDYEDQSTQSPDAYFDAIVDSTGSLLGQVGAVAAKNRTQLRLLGLHAAVLRYKWDTGKLPASLEEVVPANLAKDPLSGQEFVYELQGVWGFRIYSRGTPELGEIALKYKRSPTVHNIGDDGPVPPQ